ncbi:MAG: hypothetical protein OK438_05165 [Thaumarchaeota archaeon]|nr:hypothetical protein [Nitrososphaerota archaeon]
MSQACCISCPTCNEVPLQLTERELQICEAVCSSSTPIGFSALKRSVGYHQEIVSRVLKRLLVYGAIERVRGKYRRKVGQ